MTFPADHRPPVAWIAGRWFSTGLAVGLLVLTIVAFAPSLLDGSGRNVPLPLTGIVIVHMCLGSAFILLFVAQATLVAMRSVAAHRRTGMLAAVVAFAFVVTGVLTDIEQARRGFDLSGDLFPAALTPTGDSTSTLGAVFLFFIFGAFVAAGLVFRHRPDVHKRLMLMAVVGGLWSTPLAHLLGHWRVLGLPALIIEFGSLVLLIALLAAHDRALEGRVHPTTLWASAVMIVAPLFILGVILPSRMWQGVSAWLLA